MFKLYLEQNSLRIGTEAMRKEINAGKKARGLVRVEYGLARVERWLEPADQIDYLTRRSLLGRVNWRVTTRARSVRASVGAEFSRAGAARG